ncbi:MAG: cupin domain-containing protein [Rubricoccaceae bacterium]|nr:cupin domain-containing protein [Rubricoccaceae bacterium]
MKNPILNVNDVEFRARPERYAPQGQAAEKFEVSTADISRQLGAEKLGYNISSVPPGKAAYPFHSHRVNEEMFFVLSGSGELRILDETFPLREGDVIACPAGGPETAHQIRNVGDTDLRYLAVSTMASPEICDYPDSKKFGVYAKLQDSEDGTPRYFYFMGRHGTALDYWDGEGSESE